MLMQSVRPTIKHFQSHGKKSDDVGETKTYKDTQPFIKFLRTTFFFFFQTKRWSVLTEMDWFWFERML